MVWVTNTQQLTPTKAKKKKKIRQFDVCYRANGKPIFLSHSLVIRFHFIESATTKGREQRKKCARGRIVRNIISSYDFFSSLWRKGKLKMMKTDAEKNKRTRWTESTTEKLEKIWVFLCARHTIDRFRMGKNANFTSFIYAFRMI